MQSWENIHPDSTGSVGSILFIASNKLFVVGGGSGADPKSPLLQVATLDLQRGLWTQTAVNTSSTLNRSYAACTNVGGKVYVVGGRVGSGSAQQSCENVLEIEASRFGMTVKTCFSNYSCAKYGHSASAVGSKLNRVLVFGGKHKPTSVVPSPPAQVAAPTGKGAPTPVLPPQEIGPDGNPILDTFIISFETGHPVVIPIEFEGEVPSSRSFHSAVVCGSSNQYVLIFGGKSGNSSLHDVWLLDLTAVLIDAVPEEAIAGGKADKGKKKEAPKGGKGGAPAAIWTKLLDSKTCHGRYSHNAFVSTHPTTGHKHLFVFGGKNASGDIDHTLYSISIEALAGGAKTLTGDFTEERLPECDPTALNAALFCRDRCFGGCSVAVHDDDGRAAFLVATGTVSKTIDGKLYSVSTKMLPLNINGDSVLLNNLRDAVAANGYYATVRQDTEDEVNRIPNKIDYPNGDVYEGQLRRINADNVSNAIDNLCRHGNGKMTFANGDVYEGSWVNDFKDGEGRFQGADGTSYCGSFTNDTYHGTGTLTSAATVYQGQYRGGTYFGRGKLARVASGSVFDGNFWNGLEHGFGVLTGVWKPSVKSLFGVSTEGTIEGDWRDGVLVKGRASSVAIDGNGKWGEALKESVEAGKGLLLDAGMSSLSVAQIFPAVVAPPTTTPQGTASASIGFYSGCMLKCVPEDANGQCVYLDGSEYLGSFKSGRRNGTGKLTSVNRDEYEGKWVGNSRCGHGVWKSAHGDVYDGLWEDDKPTGYGVRTYHDGSSVAGYWTQGILTQTTE